MSQRPSSFRPLVPDIPSVNQALDRSEKLSTLMERLQASQACLRVVKSCLPPSMAPYVKSGSFDHEGWTLLAPNAAVSAKLRQLQPRFMEALARRGLQVPTIRVRVQSYEQF